MLLSPIRYSQEWLVLMFAGGNLMTFNEYETKSGIWTTIGQYLVKAYNKEKKCLQS